MTTLTYARRQEIIKAAHRERNRQISLMIDRLLTRLLEQPRLRTSRWIAAHRGW